MIHMFSFKLVLVFFVTWIILVIFFTALALIFDAGDVGGEIGVNFIIALTLAARAFGMECFFLSVMQLAFVIIKKMIREMKIFMRSRRDLFNLQE